MICDKLTNYENYKGINERVYRALEHAAHNDFSKSVAGRNDVDGDDIYYNFVKEGETVKEVSEPSYIDSQTRLF